MKRKVKVKSSTDFGTTCRGRCCCRCRRLRRCGDCGTWSSGRLVDRSNGTRSTTGTWTSRRISHDSRWTGRRRAACAGGTAARTGIPDDRTSACSRTCATQNHIGIMGWTCETIRLFYFYNTQVYNNYYYSTTAQKEPKWCEYLWYPYRQRLEITT